MPTFAITSLAGSTEINCSVTGTRRIKVSCEITGCVRKDNSSIGYRAKAPAGTGAGALEEPAGFGTGAVEDVEAGVVEDEAGLFFCSETYQAATYP